MNKAVHQDWAEVDWSEIKTDNLTERHERVQLLHNNLLQMKIIYF